MSKLFKKSRIFFLEHYFLLKENNEEFERFLNLYATLNKTNNSFLGDLEWFNDFKTKKRKIIETISKNLEKTWDISRIPTLEKAVLSNSLYEIENISPKEKKKLFLIINCAVEFSKKYLDAKSYRYINKILDKFVKEKVELINHL